MKPSKSKTKTALITSIALIAGAGAGAGIQNQTVEELQSIDEIIQEQTVKREQVLPGGAKPSDADDQAKKEGFPDNSRVDVYDGPNGGGYQIITETDQTITSIGFGPEADARTWVLSKPIDDTIDNEVTVSTTPNRI